MRLRSALLTCVFLCSCLFARLAPVLAATNPTYTWGATTTSVVNGSSATVSLSIDAAGTQTSGADVVLTYDPASIEVTSVGFTGNPYTQSFQNIDATNGKIRLSSTFTNISDSFSGVSGFAQITFTAKKVGSTSLAFVCEIAATNDTNIISKADGSDVVSCPSLTSAGVTITAAGNNVTPTSTPTPVPTAPLAGGSECSAPAAPTGLTAQAQGADSVLLKWNKGTNSTRYILQYGTSPGVYAYGVANMGDVNTFLVSFLTPQTTYYFAVAGANACVTTATTTASAITTGPKQGVPVRRSISQPPVLGIAQAPSIETLVASVDPTPVPTAVATASPATVSKLPLFLGIFSMAVAALGMILWIMIKRKEGASGINTTPVQQSPVSKPQQGAMPTSSEGPPTTSV